MTWHFSRVLTPTHQIHADVSWIATHNIVVEQPHILLVKACIKKKVINQARPECVTFISWSFSLADAASWVSNARDKIPLSNMPSEGYIQSTHAIDLPRLHRWMQDAIWNLSAASFSKEQHTNNLVQPVMMFICGHHGWNPQCKI
jgi:hypothetical protein